MQAPQDAVAGAAVGALCEVFVHYIVNYYDSIVPAPPVQCEMLVLYHVQTKYNPLQALNLNRYFIVGCIRIICN